ncbi:MAG: ISAzo13-like element transposase-related protein [Fimbriiglobus sp.]
MTAVCHDPPGSSKWNPIEHRWFRQISATWAGIVLATVAILIGWIRRTTTRTGLKVTGRVMTKNYPTGRKVSAREFRSIHLTRPETCPSGTTPSDPGPRRRTRRSSWTGTYRESGAELWDLAAEPPSRVALFRPESEARSGAFAPDGRTLALGTDDGRVTLWDAERTVAGERDRAAAGRRRAWAALPFALATLAVLAREWARLRRRFRQIGRDREFVEFMQSAGIEVRPFPNLNARPLHRRGIVAGVAAGAVIGGSAGFAAVQAYVTRPVQTVAVHTGPVTDVAWQGDTLLAGADDGTAVALRVDGGRAVAGVRLPRRRGGSGAVALSADGRTAAVAEGADVAIWDLAAAGGPGRVGEFLGNGVVAAALAPGGAATAVADRAGGVAVWARDGRPLWSGRLPGPATGLRWTDAEKVEAAGANGTVLRLRPDYAAVDRRRGEELCRQGRYAEAKAAFARAVQHPEGRR